VVNKRTFESNTREGAREYTKVGCAKVSLSFEPQIATDCESISELFTVLFNTVRHHYHELHEHGILCDEALAWLEEAVGEAMDCANMEVNSMHARDFMRPGGGGLNNALALPSTTMKAVTELFTMYGRANKEIEEGRGLFEPLVVEYLALEQMISQVRLLDHLPYSWRWARQFGYGTTRTRVEAVWAFVEAHEKVVNESPAMDRFPDLMKCLRGMINEARSDLTILEEIEPRRFFYSKNGLALRMLLNHRMSSLEKVVKAGWIAQGDGEGLMEAIRERIVQADQFFPRQTTTGFCSRPAARARISGTEHRNAWDDFEP